jgi:hypothetical protein
MIMADGRKNNGGNKNAGRKSKAEEQKLIEKLSPLEQDALKVLAKSVKAGDKWAIELFFKYMYGLPKQQIEADVQQRVINWVETAYSATDEQTD